MLSTNSKFHRSGCRNTVFLKKKFTISLPGGVKGIGVETQEKLHQEFNLQYYTDNIFKFLITGCLKRGGRLIGVRLYLFNVKATTSKLCDYF